MKRATPGGREALFKARRAAASGLAAAEELQHLGCPAGAGRRVLLSQLSTGSDGEGTAAGDIGGGGGGGAAGGMEDDEAEPAAALERVSLHVDQLCATSRSKRSHTSSPNIAALCRRAAVAASPSLSAACSCWPYEESNTSW